MLTANYDILGLTSGDKILDLGCGFGRHAFEAARRGAKPIAHEVDVPVRFQLKN